MPNESLEGKFKLTSEHHRVPLFKVIKAAENINRGKKKGNTLLVKLLERLDLDRPLILKEKLDIIWGERKSQPINVNNSRYSLDESLQQ